MSSSIFNGVNDGALSAIFAEYQVIIYKLGVSSQILQNTRRYTGKPICVTSIFLEFSMRIAMRWGKNPTLLAFIYPRGESTRAGETLPMETSPNEQ